jgi:hypothetical protein
MAVGTLVRNGRGVGGGVLDVVTRARDGRGVGGVGELAGNGRGCRGGGGGEGVGSFGRLDARSGRKLGLEAVQYIEETRGHLKACGRYAKLGSKLVEL